MHAGKNSRRSCAVLLVVGDECVCFEQSLATVITALASDPPTRDERMANATPPLVEKKKSKFLGKLHCFETVS